MGLKISSLYLCNQIAIDKMQLCSLSVAYACQYHNPTVTMEHSVHIVNISKPLSPHDAIYVVCGCEAGWTYCQIL